MEAIIQTIKITHGIINNQGGNPNGSGQITLPNIAAGEYHFLATNQRGDAAIGITDLRTKKYINNRECKVGEIRELLKNCAAGNTLIVVIIKNKAGAKNYLFINEIE
jgi:hypothetical protein